jgi:hypothetical protein
MRPASIERPGPEVRRALHARSSSNASSSGLSPGLSAASRGVAPPSAGIDNVQPLLLVRGHARLQRGEHLGRRRLRHRTIVELVGRHLVEAPAVLRTSRAPVTDSVNIDVSFSNLSIELAVISAVSPSTEIHPRT